MYAFELFLRRVWIVLRCVFYVSVGIYIHIACMFGKCIMGLSGVRVLQLQHRHVFRLFHLKCMPGTLNAYSLHLSYL
jgi:hypothetical protein